SVIPLQLVGSHVCMIDRAASIVWSFALNLHFAGDDLFLGEIYMLLFDKSAPLVVFAPLLPKFPRASIEKIVTVMIEIRTEWPCYCRFAPEPACASRASLNQGGRAARTNIPRHRATA
ncbi:hypothetical protein OIV54_31870, partial [Burkholderia pseudomallei]|uniref:hypothetical protein n=1 Tax=Burkholderia pseudomallei TaxID=28450 RepID=UPI0021F6B92D